MTDVNQPHSKPKRLKRAELLRYKMDVLLGEYSAKHSWVTNNENLKNQARGALLLIITAVLTWFSQTDVKPAWHHMIIILGAPIVLIYATEIQIQYMINKLIGSIRKIEQLFRILPTMNHEHLSMVILFDSIHQDSLRERLSAKLSLAIEPSLEKMFYVAVILFALVIVIW